MSAHLDSLEAQARVPHAAARPHRRGDADGRDARATCSPSSSSRGASAGSSLRATSTAGTDALAELLDDDRAYAAARTAVEAAQEELSWSRVGEPLGELIERVALSRLADALPGDGPLASRGRHPGPFVTRPPRSPGDRCSSLAGDLRAAAETSRVNAVASDERPVPVEGGGYDLKDTSYFAMARDDDVAALPDNPEASILEIGCSNGATGALALAQGKCRRYCGVELFPEPAAAARERLTEVVEGDVEQVELPWPAESFDALILSEVLEHLRDPWAVLDARCGRCSAPARSYSRARRTSPTGRSSSCCSRADGSFGATARSTRRISGGSRRRVSGGAFEGAGFVVDSVGPLGALGPGSAIVDRVLRGRLRHLWHRQIDLRAHVPQAAP